MGRRKDNLIFDKTKQFAVRIVLLSDYLRLKGVNYVLIKQLVASGTSIGANVREAIDGISKADFIAKMYISLKEARETEYWLDLIHETKHITDSEYESLNSDCSELIGILTAIIKSAKDNIQKE